MSSTSCWMLLRCWHLPSADCLVHPCLPCSALVEWRLAALCRQRLTPSELELKATGCVVEVGAGKCWASSLWHWISGRSASASSGNLPPACSQGYALATAHVCFQVALDSSWHLAVMASGPAWGEYRLLQCLLPHLVLPGLGFALQAKGCVAEVGVARC